MHSVLVTGGAGFIGTNFVNLLLKSRPELEVSVIDALTYAGCRSNLAEHIDSGKVRFFHRNICDEESVFDILIENSIDTIVHFAAESHVDRSISGPHGFVDTNLVGTHSLLSAAKRVWIDRDEIKVHRFHHVSTDEVFGSLELDDPPFTEVTPYAPNSPYSASKAGSDFLVRAYRETFGLSVTMSNCSNNYGPYQFPEKLIPLSICNALLGRPIRVYGDGANIRDWLHVEDHCLGILAVLERGEEGQSFNIGGKCEKTNLELIDVICSEMDHFLESNPAFLSAFPNCPKSRGSSVSSLVQFVEDRPGHDKRYAIDPRKIEKELGFVPRIDLEDGIRNLLAWMSANRGWWQSKLTN
ncbi:MAG: dTDP-glucose 4,6-dehydratase [Pseudomonadota bacterium]